MSEELIREAVEKDLNQSFINALTPDRGYDEVPIDNTLALFNQLRADLADTRQKLAEAQADSLSLADALRQIADPENYSSGKQFFFASHLQEFARRAALASAAGDALVKELERLRAEKEQETQRADYNNSLAAEKAVALSVSEKKRKEIAKDFETAFRAVRIENDALRAQRDQAVLLARVYKEAVYQTDMAHIKSAEHPDSDDLAAAWGDAAVAKRTAEVALAAFLRSLNPPSGDDTLKV